MTWVLLLVSSTIFSRAVTWFMPAKKNEEPQIFHLLFIWTNNKLIIESINYLVTSIMLWYFSTYKRCVNFFQKIASIATYIMSTTQCMLIVIVKCTQSCRPSYFSNLSMVLNNILLFRDTLNHSSADFPPTFCQGVSSYWHLLYSV